MCKANQRKIINDPVYGFIKIPHKALFKIIQHPYLQRLRRIKQLGLTNYVYPGANHSRFEHVLGAMHLMSTALENIKNKGHTISKEDMTGALTAILMHDCGHGPFSHTLESSLLKNVSHEKLSLHYMKNINREFSGELQNGIDIFQNKHPKKFLHSLVSGQLDTDRLDYLRRDSFYSGVSEGVIGSDRIIKMLDVKDDDIVVEEKGIYSIEKFLIARRIMYWQVYLHKTVVAAEQMLVKTIKRAKEIIQSRDLPASPALKFFLKENVNIDNYDKQDKEGKTPYERFAEIDDNDIFCALKQWAYDSDKVLSELSRRIIQRQLFKIDIRNSPFDPEYIKDMKKKAARKYKLSKAETDYFVFSDTISNKAYSSKKSASIKILLKNGRIKDIADASDISNIKTLSETVEKYFICRPEL